ncbi:cystathionine beta-synthase protein [Tanacetum coccineum]|uniref:Cystathionine beta-synthase protein n=1 Tax=Tanacetum coccineum TaxID=301880 RepID=A0ABQ5GF26_9ASTR
MKTKFFLCMRPPVMETDDGDYVKLPPTVRSSYTKVTSKTSGRRKRVAPEKYTRQLSVKSNTNSLSGEISENKQENPDEKGNKKCEKPIIPVSDMNIPVAFSGEKSVCMEKVNGGYQSKSGLYIMVGSLFFTIFLGKFLGILCTLILVYFIYPHRKNDGNDGRRLENIEVKSPEKGSPEDYNKRVIMEGLLKRSHNRG